MIFSAEGLSHFGIQKRDERESSERFRDENVRHFAEFAEIVAQVISRNIFRAATHKDFAGNLRTTTLQFNF